MGGESGKINSWYKKALILVVLCAITALLCNVFLNYSKVQELRTKIDKPLAEYAVSKNNKDIDKALAAIYAENDAVKLTSFYKEFGVDIIKLDKIDIRKVKDYLLQLQKSYDKDDGRTNKIEILVSSIDQRLDELLAEEQKINNYVSAGKFVEAKQMLEQLIEARPFAAKDYYGNLAYCYGSLYDQKNAILYTQKQIDAFPKASNGYAKMGNILLRIIKYDESIPSEQKAALYDKSMPYLQKAVAIDDNSEAHEDLAYIYKVKHDQAKRIEHLKKVVELDPQSLGAADLQEISDSGVPIDNSTIILFNMKKYADLEKKLQKLADNNQKDVDGMSLLWLEIAELNPHKENSQTWGWTINNMQEWLKERPDSYLANLVAANLYFHYGWYERGSGFVKTVNNLGWDKFYVNLQMADKYAKKSLELNPKNVFALVLLANTTTQLLDNTDNNARIALLKKYVEQVVAIDPDCFEIYEDVHNFLLPKWFGSWEVAHEFTKNAADNASKSSVIASIIAKYHWDVYWGWYEHPDEQAAYFKNKTAYQETKDGYEKALLAYPNSPRLINWLARTAYLAEDWATAQKMMDKIGGNPLPACWGSKGYFNEKKLEVQKHLRDASKNPASSTKVITSSAGTTLRQIMNNL